MVWSGGNYTKGNNSTGGWVGDASLGIGIEAGRHDTQDNDFATGINQCLNKDGSNSATGPLNAGGFKLTNVANGTVTTDAMAYGQIRNGTPLYMDTVNNRLGIGTTAPTSALTTIGNSLLAPNISTTAADTYYEARVTGTADGSPNFIRVGVDGASLNGVAYIDARNVGVSAATPLTFRNNGTERMRISSVGNVGIGVAPTSGNRVQIQGADTTGTANSLIVQNSAAAITLQIRNDGLVNTGTAALSPYNLTTAVAANMVVSSDGNLNRSTSSLKYKTDVSDLVHGLAEVLQLRPVTYKGKNDGETIFGGLIAEEVDAIGLTEFVQYADDDTPDALAYGNMVSLAFKAIQELNAKVEALEARVAALEAA